MNIIIQNKIITEPIINIIKQIRYESKNYFFDEIQNKGDYLRVTCPFHKDGKESHPSCSIYQKIDNPNICAGTLHCFTCGAKYQLFSVVSYCLGLNDDELGKEWLVQRFGSLFDQTQFELPELVLNEEETFLSDELLDQFEYNNLDALNYLIEKRHLSLDVIRQFKIGFDTKTRSITFPTRNSQGKLVGIFKRSIDNKKFIIPSNIKKPIYLLDYIIKSNITEVYVVESQINALTLFTWNKPAIALFGTGTDYQYEELKKSGIRHYILCFDGDRAGLSGRKRFIENMNTDVIIDYIQLPFNKDVNDLTRDQFEFLEENMYVY